MGDPSRLQQVILNLAVNAIKFTESGTVEVGARCLRRNAGTATIECWVRDTGIGIAPDQIGKLFSEFTQAESSISRRFGGTGLGLAISRRIIEQMHGTIGVSSSAGAGSTFSFEVTLPIADAAALTATPNHSATSNIAAILSGLARPLRILLAEDNGTNQLVFSKLMQGLNVALTIAANGREALEHATASTFDIMFMDMRMPEMDGLEATRAIRMLGGAWSAIPIIALTANAFAEDVRNCHEAGMNDFIAKPVRKKILLERIAVALADHPAFRSAANSAAVIPVLAPPARYAPILDGATIGDLAEALGAEDVRLMFSVFTAETIARLDRLRGLSCENDRGRIKDEAHTLKGAAGTTGLLALAQLAAQLEQSAMAIAPSDYVELVKRLEASFKVAQVEVDSALAGMAAAA
jgi:CheY-like chemotaxis protein/HPt (histidine-containing phosphotransfer) domain-containing protein